MLPCGFDAGVLRKDDEGAGVILEDKGRSNVVFLYESSSRGHCYSAPSSLSERPYRPSSILLYLTETPKKAVTD